MNLKLARFCFVTILALLASGKIFARFNSAPSWLTQAAARPTPPNLGGAHAVVLYDDTLREVDAQGISTVTHRFAIRLLSIEGKSSAAAQVYYLQGSDRIRTNDAWLIRNREEVKSPHSNDWSDVSADPYGALYSEVRYKFFSRADDAVSGDVFGAETQVTGSMLAADDIYEWGWADLPVIEESYHIRVPAGFVIKSSIHGENPPAISESADRREAVWTVRDRPFILAELHAPHSNPLNPLLLVRIEPPAGAVQFKPVVLHTWSDVAVWLHTLNAAQCDTNPALSEKARQLAVGCDTPLSKLRAIGAYVQSLRYVAVDEALSKGLGYQARKATQVFAKGYGDCKDKSNLLCAMLREVGIEAFVAVARSGDDRTIWPEFPSAAQFDHAITAIRLDETVNLPSIQTTEKWGRLLFFDPTNQHTHVGDLPWYLQGTSVFVQADGSDGLVQLPLIASHDGHAYTRKVVLQLDPTGSCTGRASILGGGQAGAELRNGLFRASTDEALRKFAIEQLGESAKAIQLAKIVRHDDPATEMCGISFEFTHTNYVQFLKNSLGVVKGDILSRGALPALTATERRVPVKLRPLAFDDEIELILPASMQSEELPVAVSLTSDFGSYQREFRVDGTSIKLTRKLELKQQLVPVNQYPALRKFLTDLAKADRASMLLRTGI